MPERISNVSALHPTRSPDGARSSVLVEVRGHVFQAVFVCLPTGTLSEPTIHGTRADAMTAEQRIELEAEARIQAMQLKERHDIELLAGMSVVKMPDLLCCVSHAPASAPRGERHRPEDWDAFSGTDEVPVPPVACPVLSADEWEGSPVWVFWGTLDTPVDDERETRAALAERLRLELHARHVQVRDVWLGRPEVLAFFDAK